MKEGFFEAGKRYVSRREDGTILCEFWCLGVGNYPGTDTILATGYERFHRRQRVYQGKGFITPWQLEAKPETSWKIIDWKEEN